MKAKNLWYTFSGKIVHFGFFIECQRDSEIFILIKSWAALTIFLFYFPWSWYPLEFGFLKAKILWYTFFRKKSSILVFIECQRVSKIFVKYLHNLSLLFLLTIPTGIWLLAKNLWYTFSGKKIGQKYNNYINSVMLAGLGGGVTSICIFQTTGLPRLVWNETIRKHGILMFL